VNEEKPSGTSPVEPQAAAIDAAAAREIIGREKAARSQACARAVESVCKQFNCQIQIVQVWVNGQPGQQQVQFVALDSSGET